MQRPVCMIMCYIERSCHCPASRKSVTTGRQWVQVCLWLQRLLTQLPGCVQSVAEITRIVQEARTPPAGPAGWENDEYIDDAMDQEAYESSFDEWGMGTSM